MARSGGKGGTGCTGCIGLIVILLILFGIVELVIYFNPSIVVNATAAVQNVQPTCNGEPMSPGDVCEVYENDVLVRTDSYEDRLAQVQGPAEGWAQFTITLAQPGVEISGLVALSIGLLIILPPIILMPIQKARTRYRERRRSLSADPVVKIRPVQEGSHGGELSGYTSVLTQPPHLSSEKSSETSKPTTKSKEPNPEVYLWFNKGRTYHQAQQYQEAIDAYSRAIALDPSDAWEYYNRGNAHYDLKRYKEAVADYDRSLEIDPDLDLAKTKRASAQRFLTGRSKA